MTRTPEEITALRAAVVLEALSWCGTPFADCSGVKGAGCDCVHLIFAAYVAAGLIPDGQIEAYKPQWFLHKEEPRFLDGVAARGAVRIEHEAALPGDILMYSFGRHAAHGAIIVDANTIVHAYKPVGKVTRGSRREFEHRLDSAWSIF